jgi:hypothetical protein
LETGPKEINRALSLQKTVTHPSQPSSFMPTSPLRGSQCFFSAGGLFLLKRFLDYLCGSVSCDAPVAMANIYVS